MLAKCPPLKILAKCLLAKCPLAKCQLAKCPGFVGNRSILDRDNANPMHIQCSWLVSGHLANGHLVNICRGDI